MRAALYARVSSEQQAEAGTIGSQVEALREPRYRRLSGATVTKEGWQMRIAVVILLSFSSVICLEAKDLILSVDLRATEQYRDGFYFAWVLDNRQNQENIGFAQRGLFNVRVPVRLAGETTAKALQESLQAVFRQQEDYQAIVLSIEELQVEEETRAFTEIARARATLAFCRPDGDGGLVLLHRANSLVESQAADVTHLHQGNLERALVSCLADFAMANINYDSRDAYEIRPAVAADNEQRSTQVVRRIVMPGGYIGLNSYGASIAFLMYVDTDSHWTIPLYLQPRYIWIAADPDIAAAQMTMFAAGLGVMRLFPESNAALIFGLRVPLGIERVQYYDGRKDENFFYGLELEQSVVLIPTGKAGLVLSLGGFEEYLFNSDLYPWDLGLKVQVGFVF